MPTVHRLGPYRFFFYSDENRETFWLSPVSLRDAQGYTPREIERIRRIAIGSRDMMLRRWHEYFDHLG